MFAPHPPPTTNWSLSARVSYRQQPRALFTEHCWRPPRSLRCNLLHSPIRRLSPHCARQSRGKAVSAPPDGDHSSVSGFLSHQDSLDRSVDSHQSRDKNTEGETAWAESLILAQTEKENESAPRSPEITLQQTH